MVGDLAEYLDTLTNQIVFLLRISYKLVQRLLAGTMPPITTAYLASFATVLPINKVTRNATSAI